jgi:diguanylate cyclase (GGDEF)-like protein
MTGISDIRSEVTMSVEPAEDDAAATEGAPGAAREGATMASAFDLSQGSHISGSTTAVIVRWVRNQLGDDAVQEMIDHAGEKRPPAQLEDVSEWSSYLQATALLEAALRVTGRPDAARRIGEEMLSQHRGTAVVDLLRSLGSPEALLASIAESGSKFSTVFMLTPQEVGPGHAEVVGSTPPGVPRHRLLCDFTVGILSIIPTVFDLAPAVVSQRECQARGGKRCVYVLSWNPERVPGLSGIDQRVHSLENQLDAAQMHLNALRATAADVVAASDLDTALDVLTRRAGQAVRATRYLLAVRMPQESQLRVHSCGLTEAEAQALAPQLLGGEANPSRLVVQVSSAARQYGVLAAMLPGEGRFFPQEREVLATYAGYAASALDTASALEEARRQNQTARALLDLSRELAEVAAPREVAQRLASAVPHVVDCDTATVLLWDEADQVLRLAASHNLDPDVVALLTDRGIGLSDTPKLETMIAELEPLFVHPSDDEPFLQGLLHQSGTSAAIVVPIVAGRRFHGVVTAGVTHEPTRIERNHDLSERLEGLANQAAIALTNAQLLAELQHRARHDDVTRLPNRAALVDDLEQALAQGRRDGSECALLFLDLDGFKSVNDTLGHLAGDELLAHVAQRLQSTVREGDTVARLGGDEFGVLLPQIAAADDAEKTATRILACLAEPFALATSSGRMVSVGVSIGVTFGRRGLTSSTEMLQAADSAMYMAKANGGNDVVNAGISGTGREHGDLSGGRSRAHQQLPLPRASAEDMATRSLS